MSYGIIRIQKFKAQAVRGIKIHDSREKPSRTNPDIDRSRSDLNYDLVECSDYEEAIQERLKTLESKRAVRKDAVVMVQCLVTSDHDYFKDMPASRQREFFEQSLEFIAERYGRDNIISATVHMDEMTPHMHVNFTPIRGQKLTAKTIFDRNELRGLQTDFHVSVGQLWGLERGESREDKRRHLSTEEYKLKARADDLKQEAERLQEQAEAAEKTLQDIALPKTGFFGGKKKLEDHIELLQGSLADKYLIDKENIELRVRVENLTLQVETLKKKITPLEIKLFDEMQDNRKKRAVLSREIEKYRLQLGEINSFFNENPSIKENFNQYISKKNSIAMTEKAKEEADREKKAKDRYESLIGSAPATPKQSTPTPRPEVPKELDVPAMPDEKERLAVERHFIVMSVGNGKPEQERRADAKQYANEWAALPAAQRDAYKERKTQALKDTVRKRRLERSKSQDRGW